MGLFILVEKTILNYEIIHFSSHETAIGVIWRTNYWFTPYVKRGIYQNSATGFRFERFDQTMIPWVCILIYSMNPRRVVNMRYSGNL